MKKFFLLLLALGLRNLYSYSEKKGGLVICSNDKKISVAVEYEKEEDKKNYGYVSPGKCFSWSWDKVIKSFKDNKLDAIYLSDIKVKDFSYESNKINCVLPEESGSDYGTYHYSEEGNGTPCHEHFKTSQYDDIAT